LGCLPADYSDVLHFPKLVTVPVLLICGAGWADTDFAGAAAFKRTSNRNIATMKGCPCGGFSSGGVLVAFTTAGSFVVDCYRNSCRNRMKLLPKYLLLTLFVAPDFVPEPVKSILSPFAQVSRKSLFPKQLL
jgi:hypothetical protein